jgi:hypothetical protein
MAGDETSASSASGNAAPFANIAVGSMNDGASRKPWETIAIFAVGVLALIGAVVIAIVIKDPNEFQLRVFQVVLATAAGGIGALLPGAFGLNLPFVRAVGAAGLFAFVYWVDPPSIHYGKTKTAFEDAIRQAETALNTGGMYPIAEQKFLEASKADPKSPLPYSGLGRAYYKQGAFESSVQSFQKAFELSGQKDPVVLYHKANSEIALQRPDDAAKTFEVATKLGGSVKESEIARLILYDFGATRFAQWRSTNESLTSPHYQEAVTNFTLYLENGGAPKQWAYYHLACLKATNALKRGDADPQAKTLRAAAVSALASVVDEIKNFRGEHRTYHVNLIKTMLATPTKYRQQLGDPPGCPSVAKVWVKERGPIARLLGPLDT